MGLLHIWAMERSFRITGRSRASCIFAEGDKISLTYVRDNVKGLVRIGTRYMDWGLSARVPGDLQAMIDIEDAQGVDEAITWVTVGREIAMIIALATNAAVMPMEGELVFETTTDADEREHFQRFMVGDLPTLRSRFVPIEATLALMSAVGTSPERNRLLRATSQFSEALNRWGMGNELPCLAHLFIGMEAITKASLRKYQADTGKSDDDLANEWGCDRTRLPNPKNLGAFLHHKARVHLAFHGDELHHDIAKKVSDDFEHGLQNAGSLFAPARNALVPTIAHLRRAILEVAGLAPEHIVTLNSAPFHNPVGPGGFEFYLRSKMIGVAPDHLDGPNQPCWDWTHSIKQFEFDSTANKYKFAPDHKMQPRLPEGVKFKNPGFEMWDGGTYLPPSAADTVETEEP